MKKPKSPLEIERAAFYEKPTPEQRHETEIKARAKPFLTLSDECLMFYRGWTVHVTALRGQRPEWDSIAVSYLDGRPDVLKLRSRPLRTVYRKERRIIKKKALGIMTKEWERQEKKKISSDQLLFDF